MTVSRAALRAPIFLSLAMILAYGPLAVATRAVCRDLIPRIGEIDARIVTEAAAWLYGITVLA